MWLDIIMDDWNLDAKPLSKWQELQLCESKMPNFFNQKNNKQC